MKNLLLSLSILSVVIFVTSCKKQPNYSAADHTVGLTAVHLWSGNAHGNTQKDTLISGNSTKWLAAFNHNIIDSSFAIQKVDGYSISVLGATLQWVTTDSFTDKTVKFAVTLGNTTTPTTLIYYFAKDSIVLDYHKLGEYHPGTGQNYYTDEFLYTHVQP